MWVMGITGLGPLVKYVSFGFWTCPKTEFLSFLPFFIETKRPDLVFKQQTHQKVLQAQVPLLVEVLLLLNT